MMNNLVLERVSLNNSSHREGVILLLENYFIDPMGAEEVMPEGMGNRIIEGLLKHDNYRGFLISCDNRFVALANCFVNFSTFKARPLLNIHDFVVLNSARGEGVGHFLLDCIEQYAVEQEFCRVNLEVRSDNYLAKALYRKHGFRDCIAPMFFWEKNI